MKQGVESVALMKIAEKYSREKYVTVEVVQLPYDELYEKEQQQLDTPQNTDHTSRFDVFMVDDPWLYALAKGGRLQRLTELLKEQEADFFPATRTVASYCPSAQNCSEYYGIPFVANSQLFVFRKSEFGGKIPVPGTWEEVLNDSAQLERERPGTIGYVTRIGPGNSVVTDFLPILWAYDSDSFPKIPAKEPPLKNAEPALAALKSLVATREKLGSASFDDFDVSAYLQKRRAAMGIAWSAWAMMLVEVDESQPQGGGEHVDEDLTFTDIPHSSADSQPELGVWLLAVPYNAPHTMMATDFIRYAADLGNDVQSQQHSQSLLAARSGTPPPRISVLGKLAEEPKYKDKHPSLIPAIERSLRAGRERPRTPCWRKIESRLGAYLETLIEQCVRPKDITACANKDLTRLFDANKCETEQIPIDIPCLEQTISASVCKTSK
ncbi:MAG: extracellular solute-binding protein [Acidobacteriaceae bacterium]